ncbi:hypothetical protein G6F22_019894 [Rhizopus arrhizus]|nr:hypothetical protein G6F22_019894 [Rhizopus arrhizus]
MADARKPGGKAMLKTVEGWQGGNQHCRCRPVQWRDPRDRQRVDAEVTTTGESTLSAAVAQRLPPSPPLNQNHRCEADDALPHASSSLDRPCQSEADPGFQVIT